jgi:predicted amidohydrolase
MKIGYLQINPRFLRVEENVGRALKALEKTQSDLVVLPELFSTGYVFRSKAEVRRGAERAAGGPTVRALTDFARRRGMAVAAGIAERSGGKFYNSAVLVTPRDVFLYRKVHLFGRERKFFTPGNLGFPVFSYKGAKVGLMVCFDWFFPEACRTLALKGAQLIAHPANLVLPWCPEAMKTRCLENRVFAVTADRVGRERGLTFIGRSQIVSPEGKVLRRASAVREESGGVELDLSRALAKRLSSGNHLLADRRPGMYR